ncbi:MAG: indolepyruvate ferredoxin oxidoreductase, alpha subunit [Clostridia bacterium]|nr:indolepyruvate ferredoxin oxidoreductase, alpha subunit [Clostridia bacterium]
MQKRKFIMGDDAMALGAIEAGVKVVTGYPGTPATEILEVIAKERPDLYVEWSSNEKVATEVAMGASLANMRTLAVMKHNGTNVATDMIMHFAFTGVKGGYVLVSADDPGANSSQNEEDTRILLHTYGHLPILDPASPEEAKEMMKNAFDLSEKTGSAYVLRPVMRVCHARAIIEEGESTAPDREPSFEPDRSRFVMSAVNEPKAGGKMRPMWRHELLNAKQEEYKEISEKSPFNWIEEGKGRTGFIGCGIGFAYIKEAFSHLDLNLPILKIGTLPLPPQKVRQFLKGLERVVVVEEIEPVVERMIKEICFEDGLKVEVLGREKFLPAEGELNTQIVLDAISKLGIKELPEEFKPFDKPKMPIRTRTQCVGCSHRSLLNAMKEVTRKYKGIVTGDIGCHDAGSFPPIELQSTIYCMGASIPMAAGLASTGLDRPVVAMIGDSTFFHMGLPGLVSASYNGANITVVIGENGTTAMTGFQPHAGSGVDVRENEVPKISIEAVAKAVGATVRTVNPYNIAETKKALEEAIKEKGVSVVVAKAPCFLRNSKSDQLFFTPRAVEVDVDRCNGCKICINDFGCPSLRYMDGKVSIDKATCVMCGMCADVCKRGAIV